MKCPNCQQTVETGAAFCGNCGFQLQNQVQANPAAYAAALPAQQTGETRALLAVLFGVIGLVGSLFMALLGLGLGLAGVILGTTTRSGPKRGLSTAGLILSSLAIIAGLAVWTYAVNHDAALKKSQAATAEGPTVVARNLSTPCYSFSFANKLNISHSGNSCDMRAFNGSTIESSTDAYKVYASNSSISSAAVFMQMAKQAIEKDIKDNLPGYVIADERVGAFAGSPDYSAVASDKSQGVTVAEAAVYHAGKGGDNVFVLVHAITGNSADLSALEAQWQWQ